MWLTGLPSAGKTTLAAALGARLTADGHRVELLDGDVVRSHLSSDLRYTREDRIANILRVGFIAHLLSRNGVVAVCSLVSPYRVARDRVRAMHDGRFVEVWVSTPPDVCASRDVKGLYARQRAGEMTGLTGVDDPYEPPLRPEVVVPTQALSRDESVDAIWAALPTWLTRHGR
ncbi:MAG: adenylyl-sulfate kinase [Acidimicrobiales bacterium]